jgi:thiol-disulfide isomerase/thioredoxin
MFTKLVLTLLAAATGVCLWLVAVHLPVDPFMLKAAGAGEPPIATAPEFTEVTDWINSKPIKLADQKGRVVLVHFWTNGCINCVHNYPHYNAWQDKYKDNKEFLMVGIHTPEFDSEKNIYRIKDRALKNKLSFAIAVDNSGANWKAWKNEFWPCIYLVDKEGKIRHRWDGELGEADFKKVTTQIDELLAEKPEAKK